MLKISACLFSSQAFLPNNLTKATLPAVIDSIIHTGIKDVKRALYISYRSKVAYSKIKNYIFKILGLATLNVFTFIKVAGGGRVR